MSCGFEARCGRPSNHRGHHGGWRTGVQLGVPDRHPVNDRGKELTAQQLRVVAEYLVHGDMRAAGDCMGIAYPTVRNHAHRAIERSGATSVVQIPYLLGWVTVPAGLGHAGVAA